MFRGCVRTSLTLDIVVAGALIVGRYPTVSCTTSLSLRMRMLNPVQLLMAWSSSGFSIRVSNYLKFLTWHPGPCLSVFISYYVVALIR